MGRESLYFEDWFLKAKQDLCRVENLLKLEDIEGASFHLQQAVEKYLKGYLLSKGWKLRRIHELDELLNDAVAYDSNLEIFRSLCEIATEYYTLDRYPFLFDSLITRKEIGDLLEEAKKLVSKLKGYNINNEA